LSKKPPSSSIHRGLTGTRVLVGQPYLADPDLRRQYEAEIAPRSIAALEHIFARTPLPSPHRVLDLGAGTGAAGRAAQARWPDSALSSVDRIAGAGIIRTDLARAGRPSGIDGRFDLIIAAHLLGELALDTNSRARLVLGWCHELLEKNGHCILIEPALRTTSRELLALRDRLVAAGHFIVAPCLWQGACPALLRDRDFCHASADAIAQGRSRIDFSYLVLRHHGATCRELARFRIVSDPIKNKGRLCFFACGPAGRVLVTRLDRERGPANKEIEHISRGDLVHIEGATARSDGLRCTATTVIRQISHPSDLPTVT
jgi:ribosomal protein RSM22 (predicted rRNA methylase)